MNIFSEYKLRSHLCTQSDNANTWYSNSHTGCAILHSDWLLFFHVLFFFTCFINSIYCSSSISWGMRKKNNLIQKRPCFSSFIIRFLIEQVQRTTMTKHQRYKISMYNNDNNEFRVYFLRERIEDESFKQNKSFVDRHFLSLLKAYISYDEKLLCINLTVLHV